MSNFSVNSVPQPNEVALPEQTEVNAEPTVSGPKVQFENLPVYTEVVASLKGELQKLIDEGHMTPQVAEKVTNDFMFNAFTQIVKITLL